MITVNDILVKEERFPDGTLRLNTPDIHYGTYVNILWAYDNDSELFTLQCLMDTIHSISSIDSVYRLTLPYIPHARMDRVYGNNCFTLKTFCNIINNMNFNCVYVLNPHSDVATALLNNVIVKPTDAVYTFNKIRFDKGKENVIVMYPDAGAAKKFSNLIQSDYITANKVREWDTGKIKDYHIVTNGIDVKDKTILIIDDICSYGGTFYHAAKALKELGAGEIYLHVDHCENSVLKGDMIKSGLIEKIYTTDSIFTEKNDKIVITSECYRKYNEEKE